MESGWLVVGLSGVTCSGKTSLSRLLCARLPCRVVHQDRYFLPDWDPRLLPCSLPTPHRDYDVLSALRMEDCLGDIQKVLQEVPESRPRCRPVLLVEGFTVLNYPPIEKLCHLKYYLELEKEECARRRALRTYDPPDVPGYFDEYVWPRHLENRNCSATKLDGSLPLSRLELAVLSDLAGLTDLTHLGDLTHLPDLTHTTLQ